MKLDNYIIPPGFNREQLEFVIEYGHCPLSVNCPDEAIVQEPMDSHTRRSIDCSKCIYGCTTGAKRDEKGKGQEFLREFLKSRTVQNYFLTQEL